MASSIHPHITTKSDNDVLIGTGDRVVKLGFVEIHVYKLELYVDAKQCRRCLAEYAGMDLNGLLRDSSFYTCFTRGKFQKTFRLEFCRTISQAKLVGGFAEPLKSRCDAQHLEDAELLLRNLVPPEGVVEGDVLTLICSGDGETLTGVYQPASGGDEQELMTMTSGGDGGAWLALQNIYFDKDTALPTIRHSAIADLPNVFMEESACCQKELSQKEIEVAVDEELVYPGTAKQTWSEFAGRDNGPPGYKFGDFTLGVVTALGMRKPKSRARESMNETTTSTTNTNLETKDLQKKVAQLELQNQALQRTLERTKQRLDESHKELLFKIAAVLALVEAVCVLLDRVAEVYMSPWIEFLLYIAIAFGLAGRKYLTDLKAKEE